MRETRPLSPHALFHVLFQSTVRVLLLFPRPMFFSRHTMGREIRKSTVTRTTARLASSGFPRAHRAPTAWHRPHNPPSLLPTTTTDDRAKEPDTVRTRTLSRTKEWASRTCLSPNHQMLPCPVQSDAQEPATTHADRWWSPRTNGRTHRL